jgi:hypothetical protein
MKYCPNCQTTYTDDTLRFCLQDGTQLAEVSDANTDMPTVSFDDSETLVSRKPPQQVVRINVPETQQQNWERTEQPRIIEQPRIVEQPLEAKKSNTALTVLATILGMLAVFGIIGAWFLLKSRKTDVAIVNFNTAPANRPFNSNSTNAQILNANTNKSTASPTPTTTPTLDPEEVKMATSEVKDTVDEWKSSSENLDLDGNLDQYADSVDYYTAGRINRARVRADKQRAFDQYDSINFNISNMKVTPDASGKKAIAVFDKQWKFEGENKYSSGKVQQQLTLSKVGGRWLITGEKDLKTYYIEK